MPWRQQLLILFYLLPLLLQADLSCDHCKKPIEGQYYVTEQGQYHMSCYLKYIQPHCDYCGKAIEEDYTTFEDQTYHPACYRNHVAPRCAVCGDPLTDAFYKDEWGHVYHTWHESERPYCDHCGRIMSPRTSQGGRQLKDGRQLCGICGQSAVRDERTAQDLFREVRMQLILHGVEPLPTSIPLHLVYRQELQAKSQSHSAGTHGYTDTRTRTLNGRVVERKNSIYILSHLPALTYKAVLAHELLHVYLFQQDIQLSTSETEGFCNLGSELIYGLDGSPAAQRALETMAQDPHPDYGVGYRKMSKRLNQEGWVRLLDGLNTAGP